MSPPRNILGAYRRGARVTKEKSGRRNLTLCLDVLSSESGHSRLTARGPEATDRVACPATSGPVRRHQTMCGLTAAPKRSRPHIGIMHVLNKQSRTFAVVARGPLEEHNGTSCVSRWASSQVTLPTDSPTADLDCSGRQWTAVDEAVGRGRPLSTDRTSWDWCGLRP